MSTNSQQGLPCPTCGQIDAVYKVSTLHENGFSTDAYQRDIPPPTGANWAPLSDVDKNSIQDQLSRKLSPPPRPTYRRPGYPVFVYLLAVVVIATIIGQSRNTGLVQLVIDIVLVGLYTVVVLSVRSDRKSQEAEAKRKHELDLSLWQAVFSNWNKLYYCARDAIVFDPVRRRPVPPDRVRELLDVTAAEPLSGP